MTTPFHIKRLQAELSERIERNPRYSVRALARSLGIGSSALSQILAGKREISTRVAQRILDKLMLSPEEANQFLASLGETKKTKGLSRISPKLRQAADPKAQWSRPRDLTADMFRLISDWYHYAIFEMTRVEGFRGDPKWIAAELGITETEAKLAIGRMLELELLEAVDGTYRKSTASIETANKSVSTSAHRKRQKQILLKSLDSLETHPIEIRNHSAITIALDPDKLPEAKAMIQSFQRKMAEFLAQGRRRRVYELTVNLFPLTCQKT